ncbi:MAG: phenylalanine--tRNA ligase subunit alpha [Acidobacteria bacterium]|nr:phenylalanine--tRNA ligase subunit alpha [Acidobacteriota bacterium]MCB9377741.1 phenylalanine--tRNA ligase subunit alpha [Holophagales bacterium]
MADETAPAALPTPERLEEIRLSLDEALAGVRSIADWQAVKGRYGRTLDALFPLLRELPKEDRREAGQRLNGLKTTVQEALERKEQELGRAAEAARRLSARVDVTLPGRRPARGSLHPVTRVAREVAEIFLGLGYTVAEGPEVEEDRFNFGLLNFPDDHPARDAQDTLFVDGGGLLRTHTSPVQIRTMLARKPPIRVICPGRVFRNDNDLRHSPMFHQIEGLCVGEGITVGDLKGTLEAFLQRLFSPETGVRLRPSFFPFTEPSCEVDVTCQICQGSGCATCSGTGWMEILGAGMVDPRVLENCGIDPDRYSGFAFGLGLDRVAMNQWGIPNIRSLFDSDERLLRQVRG